MVDDTLLNLEILTHFLSSVGMRVIALTKVKEVVPTLQKAFATKDPCDIGVIDVQMPEMSGYDVASMYAGSTPRFPNPLTCLLILYPPGCEKVF